MAVSKEMKVKVIFDSKNSAFKEVLPLGFETTITTQVTDEDEVIPEKVGYRKNKDTGKVESYVYQPAEIKPKGTFLNLTFVGANGNVYDGDFPYRCLGKSLGDVFQKL
jgi:hypothetical protein